MPTRIGLRQLERTSMGGPMSLPLLRVHTRAVTEAVFLARRSHRSVPLLFPSEACRIADFSGGRG
jgi:hypothetical protein